jgi:uncharacterized protein
MIAQQETDLGNRLIGATEDLFSSGFAAVCLINSDSPTLPLDYLRELATALKSGDDRMDFQRMNAGIPFVLAV